MKGGYDKIGVNKGDGFMALNMREDNEIFSDVIASQVKMLDDSDIMRVIADISKGFVASKKSTVRRKQNVGKSTFCAKAKMDRTDNYRNCPFGFVYK